MSTQAGGSRIPHLGTLIVLYAAGVTAVGGALYLSRNYRYEGEPVTFLRALAWQSGVYFSWAALVPAILWLVRRVSIARGPWRSGVVVHVLACLATVSGHALLTAFLTWRLRPEGSAGRAPLGSSLPALTMERIPVDMLIYLTLIGAGFAIVNWQELRRRERDAAAVELQLATAKLDALRGQLQPHFLFNALQGVASLTRTQPDTARHMAVRLGDFLRGTLARADRTVVSLREELELLRIYLDIEQLRFRERLIVVVDVAEGALDHLVPDLILQPLVENALKHGIAPRPLGGTVTIRGRLEGDQLSLSVIDDGCGLPTGFVADTNRGIGLRTTRLRIEGFPEGRGVLSVGPGPGGAGAHVHVTLPAVRARDADNGSASQ